MGSAEGAVINRQAPTSSDPSSQLREG
jgi:hypothetical protein